MYPLYLRLAGSDYMLPFGIFKRFLVYLCSGQECTIKYHYGEMNVYYYSETCLNRTLYKPNSE
jgi:hypothetical protein